MTEPQSPRKISPEEVTVGVLLPLPREAAGARLVFGDDIGFDTSTIGEGFSLCEILPHVDGARSPITVVLASPSETGNTHAAMMVVQMAQRFQNLRWVIVCGIAGAAPDPNVNAGDEDDVFLGDIVVLNSAGVLQYDLGHERLSRRDGCATRDSYVLTPRDGAIKPHDGFLQICQSLTQDEDRGRAPWLSRLEERMPILTSANTKFRRPNSSDPTYESVERGEPVVKPRSPRRGEPRVFSGAMASGNRVLKNPYRRDELRLGKPRVLAVEMEAAGAAAACRTLGLNFTAVRGLCDYCDGQKNDDWQYYAAAAAAAYTYCVIQRIPDAPPSTDQNFEWLSRAVSAPDSGSATSTPFTLGQLGAQSPTADAGADLASREAKAVEAMIRQFLTEVRRAHAQHETTLAIRLAQAAEQDLQDIPPEASRELLSEALYEIARAHQLLAQRSQGNEKSSHERRAKDLISRIRESME